MANDLTEPSYRFREVALAAGAPPQRVRTWLDRAKAGQYEINLDADLGGGGWAKFSALDALRIAFARNLVECCVPVTRAFEIVSEYLSRRMGLLAMYKNTPAKAVLAYVQRDEIWFWPSGDAWHFSVYVGLDHPSFGSGGVPGEVFSIMRVGLVVEAVFDRLELVINEE